jgi:hypothetical protein
MVGDFVDTGGLLNIVKTVNGFSESGRSLVGGGIRGISVGNGGRVVSGGGVRDIRISSSMGVLSGGDINDVSGSLDLFTMVVMSGNGGSVSGGGGGGNVRSKERFSEEIRVSEVALTSGGNNGRFNVVVVASSFNLVSSSGGGSVEVARGHGGSEGSFNDIIVGSSVGSNVSINGSNSFVMVVSDFVMLSGGDGVFNVMRNGGSVFMVISGGGDRAVSNFVMMMSSGKSVLMVIRSGGDRAVSNFVVLSGGDGVVNMMRNGGSVLNVMVVSGDRAVSNFVMMSGDRAVNNFVMMMSGGGSVFMSVATRSGDRLEGLSASFEGSLNSGFQIRMVIDVVDDGGRSLFDFVLAVREFISVRVGFNLVVMVEMFASVLAGKSDEISSFFGLGIQHNSDDAFETTAGVVSVQAFDSLLEEFIMNFTLLVVIEVTGVSEGGQSEEGHTQRVNISLVGVTLEFKSFLGDVDEQFRSEETLFLSDDVSKETVEALSLVEVGVRELDVLGSFIVEDVAGSDVTVGEALGLEESETVDEGVGNGLEFVFREELLLLVSFSDFLVEGSAEGFNEEDDLVMGGAEARLFFSVVAQNVDNVVVLKGDSVLDVVNFVVEGLLVVKDDFLLDVFLTSLLVFDDLMFTVVSIDLLSSDDFSHRSEGFDLNGSDDDGDGTLGGSLRRVVTHLKISNNYF